MRNIHSHITLHTNKRFKNKKIKELLPAIPEVNIHMKFLAMQNFSF
jgi:hypothetical protein